MAARIREFDWSTTPLGPRARWPQSLRSAVNILLSSRYAMWMGWGGDLTFLYNDAYSPTLGIKHPRALGQPASDVWAEIWKDLKPRINAVFSTGKATWDEGLLLFLERSGFREETYHTFSYSPLWDEEGHIGGMLCVVTEETERIIGERRVETLRALASALTKATTEPEVLGTIRTVLARNQKDLPFTLAYLFEDSTPGTHGRAATLASSSGIGRGHPLAAPWIEPGADLPWPANRLLDYPAQYIQTLNRPRRLAEPPSENWQNACEQAVIVPIRQQGQEQPAGFFVAGINPYRRFDAAYSGFVDLLSGQLAAALGNARAWEAERLRAEALAEIDRAKTTFFSNVSHELRTPLTLMLSPVEELLASADEGDQRQMLEMVHRNGLRLQKLVNSLLDFARIEAGRMHAAFEPVDLTTLTADLAANFRSAMQRAGLTYEIDCEPLPSPVYVDREMWEKIVLNLLSNALKFTLRGGVRIRLRNLENQIQLDVTDTGTGIAPQELPHIFERFHRVEGTRGRSVEGTGIGLALVQELVKLHAGTISVRSRPGAGTTFSVSLPLGTAHLPPDKIKPPAEQARSNPADVFLQEALRWLPSRDDAGGDSQPATRENEITGLDHTRHKDGEPAERVMLVDDNADMRDYVGRLLGERYRVVTAANGEEALASVLADPPDLILSDVMMPAMGGFGLLAELRKHRATRTIPFILLSARAGEESRVEGFDAGADDYLIKPFTARELLARVGAHLAMKKRREEAERAVTDSQTTLQSFYDSSTFIMGIAEIGGDDLFAVYGNRAMARFLNVDAKEMIGKKGRELGLPAAVERFWLEKCRLSRQQGEAVRFEYEHPGPGSASSLGKLWLSAVVTYIGDGPNGRPRFSFVAEDITEKRRADDLLRRSNEELRRANTDLEQFAYSASHDLQEPLRQVAVYSELLTKKYGATLEPKALEYLGWCVEGAHRMEMLVHDLLAYSQAGRTSSASEAPVELNEVVENVKKNLATTIQETEATVTASPLPRLRVDAVPLTQVFQNLISNALKYRSEDPPRISITARVDREMWRFAVQDNGIGIPAEFRTQIFGIFKRLHNREAYPGTGIGLAICQRIVERYGGRIWVEPAPDRGSIFMFTLPRVQPS
jgi:signal transduction histidine kinase/CheY-like chemotaxis protein